MKYAITKFLQITLIASSMGVISFTVFANDLQLKKEKWKSLSADLHFMNESMNATKTAAELKKRNELLSTEYRARENYLKELAGLFINTLSDQREIENEFKALASDKEAMNQLSTILVTKSISKLSLSNIPEIKKFMSGYNLKYQKNAIPLFRLSGKEIERESPTDEKGGFHRGTGSIFMDISRTSNDEWLFIFMHELFHALDEKLNVASVAFSDQDLFNSILKMSKNYKNLVELSPEDDALLERWVLLGLDRGLFAEYRDWNFCFNVYEKGINEGLWKKIPFVEQVLSFKDKNEDMSTFIYRYLNERSKMPDHGIVSRAIILEKVQEKREQFNPSLSK